MARRKAGHRTIIKFISKAIKHPGELTRFAKRHECKDHGNIDLACVQSHISRMGKGRRKTHLQRALNLAKTLRKLRA